MGKVVTILGMGPSAMERRWDIRRYCQGEIWTLNNAYHQFGHLLERGPGEPAPVVSRWFELHSWDYLKTWQAGVPDHFAKLDSLGIPVYVSEPLPVIRNQVRVDWVKVFSHFQSQQGGIATNYFLGSPSLMLALALYEHDLGDKLDGVMSWGIDTSDPTHKQQRQSWAYWCGQVHARHLPLGGTMGEFFTEPDLDAGLAGLRERIGNAIEKAARAAAPATAPEPNQQPAPQP